MRRTLGLAAAAVLAAGTLGVQTADAARPPARAGSALSALAEHPGAARAADGQAFRATRIIVDPDGATHVRMERSFHGVPVLGGDLVVHRGPEATWRGASQTLAAARSSDSDVSQSL